mgnify:CR=1 FL=1
MDIYRAILTRPHTYPSPAELPHSPELRDLLDRMLHKDPARRLQLKVGGGGQGRGRGRGRGGEGESLAREAGQAGRGQTQKVFSAALTCGL